MSFFESLLLLVLAAILLLQVSRRISLPYPAMLAAAGVVIALIPGAPTIRIDPATALALFIAPALVDAAFDFPVKDVRRFWRPLLALAVFAVLLSAAAVAWIGVQFAGLPLYAALALGAAVAPPDAAAASATLSSVRMPRQSVAVLKGESLLNDALALLLFSAALALQAQGGINGEVALELVIAAPGGIALGILLALVQSRVSALVRGTLGENLLQFVAAFGVWILAERLHLSPILCLVAFSMTLARSAGLSQTARMRVHSYAVWTAVVFLLNVLAFLIMGMQARIIVAGMSAERLRDAAEFAAIVIGALIAIRLVWVIGYNRLARSFPALRGDYPAASWRQALLVGWCGMRGLVTLATAFALPADFPQRDLLVLTAFAVVLATLVIQGISLIPLVRLLKLDGEDGLGEELQAARREMAEAGLAALDSESGAAADYVRAGLTLALTSQSDAGTSPKHVLGRASLNAQRNMLERLRDSQRVGPDAYLILQEELDFRELATSSEDERSIEEA